MNPMSWLFIPTSVRSKADVEKYCETCGQYQRAGGICKRHCSRRKRMMLEAEEAAAAVLGLVILETDGRHMLTEAAERKDGK